MFLYQYVILRNMVSIISRISKGTAMDQIYLPKSRPIGFAAGDFVEIIPTNKKKSDFYTYRVPSLGAIKSQIKDELFNYFSSLDNVIITGSYLEEGFRFNDIDVVLIGIDKPGPKWKTYFKDKFGIEVHFICLSRESLLRGLKTDPLFQLMLSRYLARKREFFRFKNEFDYRHLDLHLHKSKTMIDNFDILAGKEKYELVRNMVAIKLFLQEAKLSTEAVDKEIKDLFGKDAVYQLKENLLEKKAFLKRYKIIYNQTFNQIMWEIKHDSK